MTLYADDRVNPSAAKMDEWGGVRFPLFLLRHPRSARRQGLRASESSSRDYEDALWSLLTLGDARLTTCEALLVLRRLKLEATLNHAAAERAVPEKVRFGHWSAP